MLVTKKILQSFIEIGLKVTQSNSLFRMNKKKLRKMVYNSIKEGNIYMWRHLLEEKTIKDKLENIVINVPK